MFLALFCLLFGCRRHSVDFVAESLVFAKQDPYARFDAANVEGRVEKALLQWKSEKANAEPMILYAIIADANLGEHPNPKVPLMCKIFDEDSDVIGLGVREQYTDQAGQTVMLDEKYPLDVHRAPFYSDSPTIIMMLEVDVHIRNQNQRKDETQWEAYVSGVGIDVNGMLDGDYWEKTLPPVWVSMPEAGKLDVFVYAIDSEGNMSSPIPLVLCQGRANRKP